MKTNYLDEDIWNLLIRDTIKHDRKRIQNLEDYSKMLNGLIWYNSNPQSPKFQKLDNEIETFRDYCRKVENRFWRYNPDVFNNMM
jgi:hypothetical protein